MAMPVRRVLLINSGRYVEQELAAEFGPLPPALLPVGPARLYELQAQLLAPLDGDLFLTLPDDFDLPAWDAERLRTLGFTVIRTPEALSLGAALLVTLGTIGFADRPLTLLHGDTLVSDVDLAATDVVAAADTGDGYRWALVTLGSDASVRAVASPATTSAATSTRLCGYFAFASVARFAERLALAGGDFFAALNSQADEGALHAIEPGRWLDFGHVQTFFRSRRVVTTQRAFNSLDIDETRVRKRSAHAPGKLHAEARWLREVPARLAPFCARVLDSGEDDAGFFYDTEYEYLPTLAELHVSGRVGEASWQRILGSCRSFVEATVAAAEGEAENDCLQRLVINKTAARLHDYARGAGIDPDRPTRLNGRPAPSLHRCLDDIVSVLRAAGSRPAVMHGDLCFSNILYNLRTERIRVIDPRAIDAAGAFSMAGDCRYDLAKLMHSIVGRYDLIVAGQCAAARPSAQAFQLDFPPDPHRARIEAMAQDLSMAGIRLASAPVWAVMTSLFLSMPPLHDDRPDRQVGFIANALRLHAELEKR